MVATRFNRRRFLTSALALMAGVRLARARTAGTTSADVLVIGAGVAGLTAAARLAAAGRSVIVLEGRDRIGGRVWTDSSIGFPLDLGAAWLHGRDTNPLVPIAEQLNLETVRTDWLSTDVFDRDGAAIPSAEVAGSHSSFKQVMKRVLEKRAYAEADTSLGEAVREAIAEVGVQGRPSLTDWQLAYLEDDYAEELDRLSLRNCRLDEEFTGGDYLLPGGYAPLVKWLGRGTDVRLAHKVLSVEHGASPVRVTTDRGVFTGRAVLVTLPIGVLKASVGARMNTVAFDPPLPDRKLEAVKNLGMGLMNKVILKFAKPFWGPDRDVLAWTGRTHGQFSMFVNGQRARGVPVLEALVVGDYARALEPASDQEHVSRALDALRTMYGPGVPVPEAVRVTRWGQDPFAGGAYSYALVGAAVDDRKALAEPVADRLFFGGEATHATLSGSVHGAYLTGIAQSDRITAVLGATKSWG